MDITYGPGGYLPELPGGNVVETVDDHGDGTATRTTYEAGEVVATETLTVPIVVPAVQPFDADLLATAEAARRAAYDAVISGGGGVMSMARLRDADQAGSEAFLAALAS